MLNSGFLVADKVTMLITRTFQGKLTRSLSQFLTSTLMIFLLALRVIRLLILAGGTVAGRVALVVRTAGLSAAMMTPATISARLVVAAIIVLLTHEAALLITRLIFRIMPATIFVVSLASGMMAASVMGAAARGLISRLGIVVVLTHESALFIPGPFASMASTAVTFMLGFSLLVPGGTTSLGILLLVRGTVVGFRVSRRMG